MKKKNKRALIAVTMITAIILYFNISGSASEDIGVNVLTMRFANSEKNTAIFNIEYFINVRNEGAATHDFQVKIKPKGIEWYPYRNCVPEEYISEVIELKGNSGTYINFTTEYRTIEHKIVNGCLYKENFEVEIIDVESSIVF